VNGQSEMLAFAWDLQTNVRAETTFIVPHLRDKKGGPERLVDVRDIYEVNANMGARRLREQIFAILPRWFTEQAEAACHETLKGGGGEPFPLRIEKMVKAFADIGVSKADIQVKVGCDIGEIDPVLLANLTIVYKSIRRGEVSKEDEFPSEATRIAEGKAKQDERGTADPFKVATIAADPAKKDEAVGAVTKATQDCAACKTVEDLQKVWDSLPIEVCRELGSTFFDDRKKEIEAPSGKTDQGKLV
jgi:hypothetical protein